jgi:peptide deformylase
MKKILPILINPNPILRKKSLPVKEAAFKGKDWREFLDDLENTMISKDGAGLAAPQVGVSEQVIVVKDENRNLFMVNPEIVKKSWARITDEEGCLSVLDERGEILYGQVERHKKVICRYLDKNGKLQRLEASDLLARVIQHEVDHLNGILFIDRVKSKLHVLKD